MRKYQSSISFYIGIVLIVVISATLASIRFLEFTNQRDQEINRLTIQITNSVVQSASGLALPIWNVDTQQIANNLVALMGDEQIVAVTLTTPEKEYRYTRSATGKPVPSEVPTMNLGKSISKSMPITLSGSTLGHLAAVASTRLLEQQIHDAMVQNLIRFTVVSIILIVALFLSLRFLVIRPLAALSSYASSIATNTTITITEPLAISTTGSQRFFGELQTLRHSLNQMLGMLNERIQELRLSQERLQLATHAATIGIWDWDITKDRLIWDDSMYSIYGIAKGHFAGAYQAWAQCIHPQDKVFVEGEIQAALAGEREYMTQFRIVWPDGSIHFIKVASTIFRSADGKPLRMVGVNYDITAQINAEKDLFRHREHLEELVDQRTAELKREQVRVEQYFNVASALSVVLNLQGNIVRINPYGCQLLGWTKEELLGRNWFRTCLPPETGEGVYQYFLGFVADSANLGSEAFSVDTYENDVFTRSGKIRRLLFRNAWVRDEHDGVIGTLSSAIDITAATEAQTALLEAKAEAERANQAKSSFLANMSHEIRTPLNAVLGYAQILDRSATISDEHRKAVQVINRSGEHLLQLINDILEMSRIESGLSTCEMENFDLPGLLDNLKSMFLQRIQDKGLTLDVSPSGPPPQYLRSDARKLRQILINLLSNSVKFTSHGSLSIMATVNAGRLTIAVRDTGAGISSAALDHLFQPFVQADEGRRRGDGTGLGLAISQGFARLLGGSLTVASTVGSGSVFTLDIPVETATGAIRQPARGHVVGLAPGQRAPRLLIAEDRAESRDLLVELMQSTGCHVEAVTNGDEAVSACQRERPDLIWMDIDMPVLDGLSAATAIRALPGPPPVIVALTAAAFTEDRARILAGGCDEMTSKPFREEELFRIMERLLGIHFTWKRASPLPVATAMLSDAELRRRLIAMPKAERTHFAYTMETGDIHACSQIISAWTDRALATAISAMLSTYALDRILSLLEENKP